MEEAEINVSIEDLLSSGAHFGHQKHRWNPKMRRFVLEERNGLYIINLAKTLSQLRKCVAVVKKTVAKGGSILFVGTKKQAKGVIRNSAEISGEFYVCERWLGGTLTNMSTIRQSIKTLEKIEKQIAAGREGVSKKKELVLLAKQQIKLDKNLSGIRSMRRLPELLIVVDPSLEKIAIAEANKLGIPVMALVDTNCNPDPITHIIPSNDDALKSISIIINTLTDAIIEQKKASNIVIVKNKTDKVENAQKNYSQVSEKMKYGEEEVTSGAE